MTNEDKKKPTPDPILRSNGVTPSERYLQNLCETAFLKLWSYPGVYRDQGKAGSTQEGKEVCDLLVIFDNHIIIFSDKSCEFPDTGDLVKDWCRWYRRAILSSAKQIWGAERWIRNFPARFFLDRKCTHPFPYDLPPADKAIFHRIVVARNSAVRSRSTLGGSGSLMIFPDIAGEAHYDKESPDFMPLSIGQIDPKKGFVHVLDDISLNILLKTLDTITDFVNYLVKKEELILSGKLLSAAGEEELIAYYLMKTDSDGQHGFVFNGDFTKVTIDEGFWDDFKTNPQRLAQIEADKISYFWDDLIAKFSLHIINSTLEDSDGTSTEDHERALRFLARLPRFHRRVFAFAFYDLIKKAEEQNHNRAVRLQKPYIQGEPCYLFLVMSDRIFKSEDEYRMVRKGALAAYCKVARLLLPNVADFVGIAIDHPANGKCSEDLLHLDTREWTQKDNEEAIELQRELKILVDLKETEINHQEYPEIRESNEKVIRVKGEEFGRKIGRNEPCPCGRGKKYKRCCLG